jgi:hypothetical protein
MWCYTAEFAKETEMTPQTPSRKLPRADESSNIGLAYQSTVSMIAYEGQLAWQATTIFVQFTILLVAGATFPSFIGTADPRPVALTGLALSSLGAMSSVAWWCMVSRSRKYYYYWILVARELESSLPEAIDLFHRGQRFAVGETVEVDGVRIHFKSLERVRMKSGLAFVYASSLVIFILLLAVNVYRVIVAF